MLSSPDEPRQRKAAAQIEGVQVRQLSDPRLTRILGARRLIRRNSRPWPPGLRPDRRASGDCETSCTRTRNDRPQPRLVAWDEANSIDVIGGADLVLPAVGECRGNFARTAQRQVAPETIEC